MRALEERLGVRLLARSTRSVAPTEAGERLLAGIAPHLDGIDAQLAALTETRDRPAGTVRITATEHAAETVLWPALTRLLPDYPDVTVEIAIDYGLTDIVADRFDAGVRSGDMVADGMISAPIGPPLRTAVVGSLAYLATRPPPLVPHDLIGHRCINLRLPTHGGLYAWEFEKHGEEVKVRVDGPLVFNTSHLMVEAALAGLGLAYLSESRALPLIEAGTLVRVLDDWCPPFPGYRLYYPSRRQHSGLSSKPCAADGRRPAIKPVPAKLKASVPLH